MKNNNLQSAEVTDQDVFITPQALLEHWQGHRRVTRRVIEAFPEDKLFTYSIGGMRPFAKLVVEMLTMAAPGIRGIVERKWEDYQDIETRLSNVKTREDLLRLWDESTREINDLWPKISSQRFQEEDKVFDTYDGTNYSHVQYFIDNEIHHRGQGYVYLRSLGIEPPHFAIRN